MLTELLFALALSNAAQPPHTEAQAACVERVLSEDDRLGRARNHAPEADSLALAVSRYVEALEQLDMRDCPADFRAAFDRHRQAWTKGADLFERHAKLRGEMHDLFDQIRTGPDGDELKAVEAGIWSTWAEVEAATR